MDKIKNNKDTTKRTGDHNQSNLDYDFNTEYGDGDIPDIDKPNPSNLVDVIPDERPRKDGPGGE